MANYTRAEYRQDIRDNVDDTSEKTWTNAYLNRQINNIRLDICSKFNFSFLETILSTSTTTATRIIHTSQVSGFNKPIYNTWSDGSSEQVLNYVSREIYENLNYTSATSGRPYLYTMLGDDIYLYPKPSQVGTLKAIYKKDPELFTDDNTPDETIPRRWADTVVQGSTAKAWELDEEFSNANQYWQKYLSGIREMKFKEGEKQIGQVPRNIGSDFEWEDEANRMTYQNIG